MLGRWIADYDDPDNFTFTLFHSGNGAPRAYFSSPETDRLLEEARAEARPGRPRGALPEVRARPARPRDPRAALPRRGLPDRGPPGPRTPAPEHRALRQLRRARKGRGGGGSGGRAAGGRRNPPRADRGRRPEHRSGALRNPGAQRGVAQPLRDAHAGARRNAHRARGSPRKCSPRDDGEAVPVPAAPGRPVPRRAAADGARRALLLGAAPHDADREPVAAVAHPRRPADHRWRDDRPRGLPHRLADASSSSSSRSPSPSSRPSSPTRRRRSSRRAPARSATTIEEGAVGTGPVPDRQLRPRPPARARAQPDLLAGGLPAQSDGIVFRFGVSPEEIRSEFLAGRFSLAFDLLPADAEAFRHDPRFASRYRENPRLTTYYVTFNGRGGPLRDVELRRSLVRAVDVGGLVRRTIGRLAIPAHGIIPPGLLGYSPASPASGPVSGASGSSRQLGRGDGLAGDDRADGRRPPRLLRRVLGLLPGALGGLSRDRIPHQAAEQDDGRVHRAAARGRRRPEHRALERRLSRRRQLRAHAPALRLRVPGPIRRQSGDRCPRRARAGRDRSPQSGTRSTAASRS